MRIATDATLNNPQRLAVDSAGTSISQIVATNRVREIEAGTGIITTVAGEVTNSLWQCSNHHCSLTKPHWYAVDGAGTLYISDQGSQ